MPTNGRWKLAQRVCGALWLLLCLGVAGSSDTAQAQTGEQLSVTFTVAPDPVLPGDNLIFKARIGNVSATTPTGTFLVRANFPQYVTTTALPNATGGCQGGCRFGGFGQWQIPSLAPGEAHVIEYIAQVDNSATNPPPAAGTVLTSDLTVLTNGVVTLKTASASAVVATTNPAARLTVGVDENRVAPGADVTFKLRFGNAGNSAQSLTLKAQLPAGVSVVSAAGGSVNGDSVEWSLGSVGASVSDRRDLVLRVAANAASGALLQLRAELLNGAAQSQVRASAVAQVASASPISMTLTSAPSTAVGGDTVLFKLHIANRSPSTPSGAFWVRMYIPDYMTLTAAPNATGGCGTCRYGAYVQWQVESLNPGESIVEQAIALVDSSATNPPPPRGELLYAEAHAFAGGGVEASDTLTISDADNLRLVTQVSHDRPAPGSTLRYRLTFGNAGSAGKALSLRAKLPAGVSFVSATGGGALADGWVQWNLGTVASGYTDRRELTVTVANDVAAGTLLTLRGELTDGNGRPLRGDAWAALVASDALLSMEMVASPGHAQGGDLVEYRLRVANRSASTPTGAFWVRLFGPGRAQITAAPDATGGCGTCRYGAYLQWQVASLDPGASTELRFNVQVDNSTQQPPPAVGDLLFAHAHAYVWGGYRTSEVLPVSNGANFDLAVTTAQDRAAPDSEVTIKLNFGNTAMNAKPARLALRLPEGTSLVGAAGATHDAGVVYWDLDMKANRWDERLLTFKLASNLASGTLLALRPELVALDDGHSYLGAGYPVLVASQSLLSMTLEPSANTAVGGDTLIYKLTLTNLSPNTPTGAFWVRASLTPYVHVTSAPEATGGCGQCTQGNLLQWNVASLAPGATRILQYTAKVDNTNQDPPPPFGSVLWSHARALVFGEVMATTTVKVGGQGIGMWVPSSDADGGTPGGQADAGANDAGDSDGGADAGSAESGVPSDADSGSADSGDAGSASSDGGAGLGDGGEDDESDAQGRGDADDEDDEGSTPETKRESGGGCSCSVASAKHAWLEGCWALLGAAALIARRRRMHAPAHRTSI